MIGAILAAFTAASIMGEEPPQLIEPFTTLAECMERATDKGVMEAARKEGKVVLCLQVRTGV